MTLSKTKPYDIKRKLDSVAILGLGPSCVQYLGDFRAAGYGRFTDEVWTINHGGYFLKDIDLIVAMDDMSWKNEEYPGYIPKLVEQTLPILTCTAYPWWPTSFSYPIEEVLSDLGIRRWINNSAAYALAYAIYRGAKKINLYGYEFTGRKHINEIKSGDPWWRKYHLPANFPVMGEPGEVCCAYLAGIAHARGIEVKVSSTSTFMDYDTGGYLYGYLDRDYP